jgi:hypothetical protein
LIGAFQSEIHTCSFMIRLRSSGKPVTEVNIMCVPGCLLAVTHAVHGHASGIRLI